MAMLTVAGFEVDILPGTQLQDAKHGDIGRAYSGKMRSDVKASHRFGRIVGSIFDTTNDAPALRAILNTPGPVVFGGTLIGDDAYFHVDNLTTSPITADRLKFDFEIVETRDSPSTLLFTLHGDALGANTFTRSGTVGPYTGSDGVLTSAIANVPRQEWTWSDATAPYPDEAWLLLESPAFTNLVSDDDLTNWTAVDMEGGEVVGSVSDPAGGTGAYTVTDDDATNVEYITLAVTGFDNGASNVVTVDVRENTMPASGAQVIRLYDATATSAVLRFVIASWSSGEPSTTASTGTFLGQRYVGNGYWRLYGLSTAVTEANTNQLEIRPADTAGQTGAIDVYRVNAFADQFAPWSILDASETKAAETFYADFTPAPQAMCGLVDFRELEDPNFSGNLRVFQIGDANNNDARLLVRRESGGNDYYISHDTGSQVTANVDLGVAWGDRVQLAWWLYSDGSVNISGRTQALGSTTWSSWTDGTQSGALALASAWSDTRLYLGSVGSTNRGSQLYNGAFVASGTSLTNTYMLDWLRARRNPREVLAQP